MSDSNKPSHAFEDFLTREAAVSGLAQREKLASIRHELEHAPPLRPLSRLWTGPQAVPFGVWGNPLQITERAAHQKIDFIGSKLPSHADEFRHIRKVKLKVDKPFVISVSEADEYRMYQIRALGGDAVLLPLAAEKIVELQYLIELGRELGLETVLYCADAAQLKLSARLDASFVAGPVGLQTMICGMPRRYLPILFIDALDDLNDLVQSDLALGIVLRLSSLENKFD